MYREKIHWLIYQLIYHRVKGKALCFTGHRLKGLTGCDENIIRKQLYDNIKRAYDKGFRIFTFGGAVGIDQWAQESAIKFSEQHSDIHIVLAMPFPSQAKVWPKHVQSRFYNVHQKCAETCIAVCDDPYAPWKMQVRNEFMVDFSDAVVAVWLGHKGGTNNCVQYALKVGVPVMHLNPKTLEEKWIMPKIEAIKYFKGEYRWLSNFYMRDQLVDGVVFKSNEHYYQSMKARTNGYRQHIMDAPTPGEAKRRGRRITMIENWDDIKLAVMHKGLLAKFAIPDLRLKLMETNPSPLEEWNNWHDDFWGVDEKTGLGVNALGKLLMFVRKDALNHS